MRVVCSNLTHPTTSHNIVIKLMYKLEIKVHLNEKTIFKVTNTGRIGKQETFTDTTVIVLTNAR